MTKCCCSSWSVLTPSANQSCGQADLNSVSSLEKALQGTHTVFLVTDYWEAKSTDTEIAHGKNVTDVAKAAGVSHIIFSSLVPVKEATNGKLSNVKHFDTKANVEKYIRASGINCTFVMPGYFMSNYLQMFRKAADGTYQLFYPIEGKKHHFPLFDPASDLGERDSFAVSGNLASDTVLTRIRIRSLCQAGTQRP